MICAKALPGHLYYIIYVLQYRMHAMIYGLHDYYYHYCNINTLDKTIKEKQKINPTYLVLILQL